MKSLSKFLRVTQLISNRTSPATWFTGHQSKVVAVWPNHLPNLRHRLVSYWPSDFIAYAGSRVSYTKWQ